MQPNQLNAAQFLTGFLEKEQGSLRRKIMASKFSKELEDQESEQKTKSTRCPSHEKEPERVSHEKIKDNLLFNSSIALESIFAQLRLTAETRQACKSAEDAEGRISCKALASILDQHARTLDAPVGQGRAAAEDVQKLLKSLLKIEEGTTSPIRLQQLEVKTKGFYTLAEFRQMLEGIVQEAARQKSATQTHGDLNLNPAKTGVDLDSSHQRTAQVDSDHSVQAKSVESKSQMTSQQDIQADSAARYESITQLNGNRIIQMTSLDSSLPYGLEDGEALQKGEIPGQTRAPNTSAPSHAAARLPMQGARIMAANGANDPTAGNDEQTKDQTFSFAGFERAAAPGPVSQNQGDTMQMVLEKLHSALVARDTSTRASLPGGQLSMQQSTWPIELSLRFQELYQQRRNHLTLELQPKHLGHLVLRIETDDNQVTAWVSADTQEAKSALLQNAGALRQHLQEQGLNLGQFSVDVKQGKESPSFTPQPRSGRKRVASTSKVQGAGVANRLISQSVYRSHPGERIISLFA